MDDDTPDGENWVTTENGEHLLLNGENEVVGGAGGALNGKKLESAKSTSSKKSGGDKPTEKPEDKASAPNPAKAIRDYQDFGYQAVNTALRNGEELTGWAKEIDEGLQEAFKNSGEESRRGYWRDSGMAVTAEAFEETGFNKILAEKYPQYNEGSIMDAWYDPEFRNDIRSSLIGYEFTDKGYTSTTKEMDSLMKFSSGNGGEDYLSEYGAKESMLIMANGARVLDLGEDGYIHGSGENETIFNKGSTFRITGVEHDGATQGFLLICEYVDKTQKE